MVLQSKSGAKDASYRKGGHLPAVKAGGRRVAFEENHGFSEKRTVKRSVTSRGSNQVSVLLTGTLDKLTHYYPVSPVSARFGKPRPALDKNSWVHDQRTYYIQQPMNFVKGIF